MNYVTTNSEYRQQLALGETYEQDLVKRFRQAGFKAARYSMGRQDISLETIDPFRVEHNRPDWKSWKRLYTLFQRDIWIKVPKTYSVVDHGVSKTVKGFKRFNVENKARNVNGFSYDTLMVGQSDRWDDIRFKVDFFVIIDQATKEARWIDVKATQDAGLWKFVASNGSKTDDHYEVPTEAFRPIQELFELLLSYQDSIEE
jgi:hypothetical protein